jgi:hypothetical protein
VLAANRDQKKVMNSRPIQVAALLSLLGFVAGCSTPRSEGLVAPALVFEVDPQTRSIEGIARGYPALRDLKGETLANGEFSQWTEGDRLHVRVRYDFSRDRWTEEQSVLLQEPTLVHERWSWLEMRAGQVYRKFEVDFRSGNATAETREGGEVHRWSEHLDLVPGRAFAGGAWPLAIRQCRERLLHGETIELQGVGFTPKPKMGTVEITHDGIDRLLMADRSLTGDRFRIHPKILWVVKLFVDVPDSLIWLTDQPPAAFLRWEGPLAEPSDSIVRVDLLPGGPSGVALPRRP